MAKKQEELMNQEYHILGLEVENFMRLKAVKFEPDPDEPVVVISGKNEQGKSSLINSIFATLNYSEASKEIPKMIHGNKEKSTTTLDLGDITVTRKITSKGTTLIVKGKEGGFKFPSPQAVMSALAGKMFDLQEFIARMSPAEQRKSLLELLDLPFDLDELEAERKRLFDARTDVNRDLKKQEGYLSTLPKPVAGLPEEEVSARDILDAIQAANNQGFMRQQKENQLTAIREKGRAKNEEIKRLEEALAQARKDKEDLLKEYNVLKEEINNLPEPPDTTALQEQLKDLERTNEGIRNNRAYTKAEAERDKLKGKSEALTKQIADIDKKKADALAAAKLPVEGLSFDEHGLIYDNAPFEQAATSAKIRVAFALQVAKNPKLRVALIRDYQFFDQENRKLIRELARKHNFQVWCEMVDPQQEPGVIIEDGMIKEIVKKPQEPKREEEAKEPVQQNLTALDQVAGEFE